MIFQQVDMTGCKLVGAFSPLGHIGPKHFVIVIGRSDINGQIYVAENRVDGYYLSTVDDVRDRYSEYGQIKVLRNDGKFSDVDVAKRALREIVNDGSKRYDLITNNCESFANRAMYGDSTSMQVVRTCLGLVVVAGLFWVLNTQRAKGVAS